MSNTEEELYFQKYLKYKLKYLELSAIEQHGGSKLATVVVTHSHRVQCLLANLFSKTQLSATDKKKKFYPGSLIKISKEGTNYYFTLLKANSSVNVDGKDVPKNKTIYWTPETFNYQFGKGNPEPQVVSENNVNSLVDIKDGLPEVTIYLVVTGTVEDGVCHEPDVKKNTHEDKPLKPCGVTEAENAGTEISTDASGSTFYFGASRFQSAIETANIIKKKLNSTEPVWVLPCTDDIAYNDDGKCDSVGSIFTAVKGLTGSYKVRTCEKEKTATGLCKDGVNWGIFTFFDTNKYACSKFPFLQLIYYLTIVKFELNIVSEKLKALDARTSGRKIFEAVKKGVKATVEATKKGVTTVQKKIDEKRSKSPASQTPVSATNPVSATQPVSATKPVPATLPVPAAQPPQLPVTAPGKIKYIKISHLLSDLSD